jgi:hypothetical protein
MSNINQDSDELNQVPLKEITRIAASIFGCRNNEVISKGRQRERVQARWACMKYLSGLGFSACSIAQTLGLKDHTSVCYGLKCYADMLETDKTFRRKMKLFFSTVSEVQLISTPIALFVDELLLNEIRKTQDKLEIAGIQFNAELSRLTALTDELSERIKQHNKDN